MADCVVGRCRASGTIGPRPAAAQVELVVVDVVAVAFLGLGSHLIAVQYSSLQISDGGKRIVLPGATKEPVKGLQEFK
jgi:hypothetical protein